MRKRAVIAIVMSIALLILPVSMVFADYTSADTQADMQSIAQNFSNLFGKNLGSISMIGDPIGYSTVPHFAVGLAAGAILVPFESIDSGTNTVYDLGGMGYAPVPSIAAHMKLTVRGFELGAKVAGIPPFELSNENFLGEVQSMVIGGKLRYRIVDKKLAVLRFGVSAGGFYDFSRGALELTMRDSFAVYEDVTGGPEEEHIADLVSTNSFDTNWQGHTVGGEVQGNIKILFFNLFVGGRMSTSWGSADTSVNGDVSVNPVSGYEIYVTANPTETIDIDTESHPDGLDYYAFGGLEVKILPVVICGRFGYNFSNDAIALDFGARLQF